MMTDMRDLSGPYWEAQWLIGELHEILDSRISINIDITHDE